jgi:hypothetical protein
MVLSVRIESTEGWILKGNGITAVTTELEAKLYKGTELCENNEIEYQETDGTISVYTAEFEWYEIRNNTEVSVGEGSTYTASLTNEDTKVYSCKATIKFLRKKE